MLGKLDTTFYGQETIHLVSGSHSWSETPHFHKWGGTLTNGAKGASERRNARFFLFSNSYN